MPALPAAETGADAEGSADDDGLGEPKQEASAIVRPMARTTRGRSV
jgi:hypothetical protein